VAKAVFGYGTPAVPLGNEVVVIARGFAAGPEGPLQATSNTTPAMKATSRQRRDKAVQS